MGGGGINQRCGSSDPKGVGGEKSLRDAFHTLKGLTFYGLVPIN